ncbi:hypothetical protein HK405_004230, partial [Cladochytrium tenue]
REGERNKLIERIQVLSEATLREYPAICGKLKEEIKNRDAAVDKETKKQQQLEKIMAKESSNRPKVNQCQMELAGATHEVAHATTALVESATRFEIRKRDDFKTCFSEFVWSEIHYHAKALEILTGYHKLIDDVVFDEDVAVS